MALACDATSTTCSRISDTDAVCTCNDGFETIIGTADACQDIDECTSGAHNCPAITTACINNDGGFDCGKFLCRYIKIPILIIFIFIPCIVTILTLIICNIYFYSLQNKYFLIKIFLVCMISYIQIIYSAFGCFYTKAGVCICVEWVCRRNKNIFIGKQKWHK